MKQQGPEPLAEILGRLFLSRGWGRRQARLRLEEAWRRAVGAAGEGKTAFHSVRHSVAEVIVGNSVFLQELAGFRKKELLEALQQQLPELRLQDLRFRLGVVREQKELES